MDAMDTFFCPLNTACLWISKWIWIQDKKQFIVENWELCFSNPCSGHLGYTNSKICEGCSWNAPMDETLCSADGFTFRAIGLETYAYVALYSLLEQLRISIWFL